MAVQRECSPPMSLLGKDPTEALRMMINSQDVFVGSVVPRVRGH
jgi:hypothetical protein